MKLHPRRQSPTYLNSTIHVLFRLAMQHTTDWVHVSLPDWQNFKLVISYLYSTHTRLGPGQHSRLTKISTDFRIACLKTVFKLLFRFILFSSMLHNKRLSAHLFRANHNHFSQNINYTHRTIIATTAMSMYW